MTDNRMQKLAARKAQQAWMTAANKLVRATVAAAVRDDLTIDEQARRLSLALQSLAAEQGLDPTKIASQTAAYGLLKPDFCGRIGFPDYAIKNNGAEIRRLEKALAPA